MEHKLIELYLLVCRLNDNQSGLKYQRLSNFRPRCTDEELVTMYLFGHLQGHTQQRRIYDYLRRHWLAWFPALPSYQAFNRRLNELLPAFELLISQELQAGGTKLVTPYKKRRNEPKTATNGSLSRFVSSMRQPLESLFGWLIQRTDLQNASRVRSMKGLPVHCYGNHA